MNPLLRVLEIAAALVAITFIAAACALLGAVDRMTARRATAPAPAKGGAR